MVQSAANTNRFTVSDNSVLSMRAMRDYEAVNLGSSEDSDGLGDLRALGRKTNLETLNGGFKSATVSIK